MDKKLIIEELETLSSKIRLLTECFGELVIEDENPKTQAKNTDEKVIKIPVKIPKKQTKEIISSSLDYHLKKIGNDYIFVQLYDQEPYDTVLKDIYDELEAGLKKFVGLRKKKGNIFEIQIKKGLTFQTIYDSIIYELIKEGGGAYQYGDVGKLTETILGRYEIKNLDGELYESKTLNGYFSRYTNAFIHNKIAVSDNNKEYKLERVIRAKIPENKKYMMFDTDEDLLTVSHRITKINKQKYDDIISETSTNLFDVNVNYLDSLIDTVDKITLDFPAENKIQFLENKKKYIDEILKKGSEINHTILLLMGINDQFAIENLELNINMGIKYEILDFQNGVFCLKNVPLENYTSDQDGFIEKYYGKMLEMLNREIVDERAKLKSQINIYDIQGIDINKFLDIDVDDFNSIVNSDLNFQNGEFNLI